MPPLESTLNHILVSLIASSLGILSGGVVIYLFSRILRQAPFQTSEIQRFMLLIPWRTIIVGILEFFYYPLPLLRFLSHAQFLEPSDTGRIFAIVRVLGQLACLLILFTPSSVFRREPRQLAPVVSFEILRSIATVSVALTTLVASGDASAGLGFYIFSSMTLRSYNFSQVISGWLTIIFICLAIDLLAGITQFLVWKPFYAQKSSAMS